MNAPGQSCGNCRFSSGTAGIVHCLRHAPRVLFDKDWDLVNVWPRMDAEEWCGDWEGKGIPKKVLADPVA